MSISTATRWAIGGLGGARDVVLLMSIATFAGVLRTRPSVPPGPERKSA
jgi:hypothetical protein